MDSNTSRQEFGLDVAPLKLNLGGTEVAFDNGLWVQDSKSGGAGHKEVMKLRKQNVSLQDENNFLKLKVDILLDMLAETSAVSHYHENELKQLRGKKR
ncbi:hypothetical protein ScPMuIL_003511 [Solemya velum]